MELKPGVGPRLGVLVLVTVGGCGWGSGKVGVKGLSRGIGGEMEGWLESG